LAGSVAVDQLQGRKIGETEVFKHALAAIPTKIKALCDLKEV
jgi:hypothetical protein